MAANHGFLDPNDVLAPPIPTVLDDPMDAQDDAVQPTQTQTQLEETQEEVEVSQKTEDNSNYWGSLLPHRAVAHRLDMSKLQTTFVVGRHHASDYRINSQKISSTHCKITWRGLLPGGDPNEVLVEDFSSNGTFINGVKIGKGQSMLLCQGNEISFGINVDHPEPNHDTRFVYRHYGNGETASGGIFEEYQLSTELGRGAFASVRRAHRHADGGTYAVKIINQRQWASSPATQKMFQREMDIIRQLNHPNIVSWINTFYDPGTIFLVMEFVNGKDLLELVIGSGNGLGEPMSRCIAHNICSGVAFLHANKIVHRDLKPENVLIHNGPPLVAKIADFGLAKMFGEQTMLKTTCGTPIYLAPEVVLGHPTQPGGYTELVDSWSVGVIVYSMLTMAMPFAEEEEELDIRERMRTREVLWDHLVNSASPQALEFCQGLIEKDYSRRWSMELALSHVWLNDPYMDLSQGYSDDMTHDSGGQGSRGGSSNGGGPRGFNSYRRANGDSAYDNSSLYGGAGGGGWTSYGDMGSRYSVGVTMPPQTMPSASEVEAHVLGFEWAHSDAANSSSTSVAVRTPQDDIPTPRPLGGSELDGDSARPVDSDNTAPNATRAAATITPQLPNSTSGSLYQALRIGDMTLGSPDKTHAESSPQRLSDQKNENGKRPRETVSLEDVDSGQTETTPSECDLGSAVEQDTFTRSRPVAKRARGSAGTEEVGEVCTVNKNLLDEAARRTARRAVGRV